MFGGCVRLFCVYVFLYLGTGLATGRSLVQEVLLIVYRFKEKRKNLDTARVRYERNGYVKINQVLLIILPSSRDYRFGNS
jgi:hypothetical protein